MRTMRWSVTGLLTASALLVAGCPFFPPNNGGNNGNAAAKSSTLLKPFNSERELLDYVRDQVSAQRTGFGFSRGTDDLAFGGPLPATNEATAGGAPAADSAAGEQGAAVDFTGTNLQEAGVDESDFIKTDGRYFYVARGKSLRVLDTKSADGASDDLREIAVLDVDARTDSIYLQNGKILLLSQDYGYGYRWGAPEIMIWPPYYNQSQLKVIEIDVNNPAAPVVSNSVELDGGLVTSRLVNNRLILVLTVSPVIPATGATRITLDEVLPKLRHADGDEALVAEWDAWLRPEYPEGLNMTAVVTLDAADIDTIVDSVAVMANAGTVYASPQALYVTDTTYDFANSYRPETAIHKFAFGEDGAARYVATGNVRGRPLNQFSLGEFDGALRVATQVENFNFFGGDTVTPIGIGGGSTGSSTGVAVETAPPATGKARLTAQAAADEFPEGVSTAVFVLSESEGRLNTAGRIIAIKPGERMYSARFLGTRGYLVTFRQIDPLFVLDLADKANPRITGELEIPGFSEYLHPVGDTHLIGVGRSTLNTPWGGTIAGGVQVSLFNVSDPANPTAVEQLTFGGNGSACDVSWNHKAFTLLQRDGEMVLGLPVQLWNYGFFGFERPATFQGSIDPPFDGIIVVDVDLATGFTERGRVASVVEGEGDYGWVEWRRAVVIDDDLFALSSGGVRAAKLSDLSVTDSVAFPPRWDSLPIPLGEGDAADGSPGVER